MKFWARYRVQAAQRLRWSRGRLLASQAGSRGAALLLLENVGADRAVQFGDPEVWRSRGRKAAAIEWVRCAPVAEACSMPQRLITAAICLIGGVLLTVIGVRYLLMPEEAARTFGVPAAGGVRTPLHHRPEERLARAAGGRLRPVREWRALALWFALGRSCVSPTRPLRQARPAELPQVAFHVGCGLACIVLAGRLPGGWGNEQADTVTWSTWGSSGGGRLWLGAEPCDLSRLCGARGWPMGAWQADVAGHCRSLGRAVRRCWRAVSRCAAHRSGRWRQRSGDSLFRLGLGRVLDGFLRVGAQSALLLAPCRGPVAICAGFGLAGTVAALFCPL